MQELWENDTIWGKYNALNSKWHKEILDKRKDYKNQKAYFINEIKQEFSKNKILKNHENI